MPRLGRRSGHSACRKARDPRCEQVLSETETQSYHDRRVSNSQLFAETASFETSISNRRRYSTRSFSARASITAVARYPKPLRPSVTSISPFISISNIFTSSVLGKGLAGGFSMNHCFGAHRLEEQEVQHLLEVDGANQAIEGPAGSAHLSRLQKNKHYTRFHITLVAVDG